MAAGPTPGPERTQLMGRLDEAAGATEAATDSTLAASDCPTLPRPSQGREIADLRTELASRRAPWWSVAGAIAAVVAVALTIINALP